MRTLRLIVMCAVVTLLPSIAGCGSGSKRLVLDGVPVSYVEQAYIVPVDLPQRLERGEEIMEAAIRVEGRYLIDKPTLSMLLKAYATLRRLEAQ